MNNILAPGLLLLAVCNSRAFDLNAGIKESNQRKYDDLKNQLDEVPVCKQFKDAVENWKYSHTDRCNIDGHSVLGHHDIPPALCEDIRTKCDENLYSIAKDRGCSE
tara:strand:- start:122 stop:439 length:318 start_codon:yes stop_codon:yes gene_type:complete